MTERQFLGRKLRDISEHYHPHKMTLREFCTELSSAVTPFENNLANLGANDERHMEEWMETFLAWFEVEQQND